MHASSDEYQRMVAEVASHAGQVMHHRDAHLLKVVGRPHARQHQQLRVSDGAAAEDYLIRLSDEPLAAALHIYAGNSLAVE